MIASSGPATVLLTGGSTRIPAKGKAFVGPVDHHSFRGTKATMPEWNPGCSRPVGAWYPRPDPQPSLRPAAWFVLRRWALLQLLDADRWCRKSPGLYNTGSGRSTSHKVDQTHVLESFLAANPRPWRTSVCSRFSLPRTGSVHDSGPFCETDATGAATSNSARIAATASG